ncbi:hypothetical protein [Tsukamurella strandjordii]|uniref:Uncharacterized protein n=1 Tax=Tsukamurella strandjordii TaxID=147577 RepID=A0AA90SHD7_9ACTN|nr:hypothetical protein [Tsukamurella strandjordii]MDP0398709.1 hypothetical protein [Tsukamurella strandjordii]
MFNHTRRLIAALALTIALAAPAAAYATPASIDDGSGPRDVGAHIEDGSGTPGPSFDEPTDIPTVGPAPTKPDKNAPQSEWDAYQQAKQNHDQQVQERANAISSERARQEAKRYRDCIARGSDTEIC